MRAVVSEDVLVLINAAEPFTEAMFEVTDYCDALLRHVFGKWGAFWFKLAADHLPDEYFDVAGNDEIQCLRGIFDKRPSGTLTVEDKVFVPTPLQKSILKALDGRAMKKKDLAREVCGGEDNGNLLYRRGDIAELRRLGLVTHKPGVGYYRPDAPPSGSIELG